MAIGVRQGTRGMSRAAARAAHRRSLGIELEGPFFTADLTKTMQANAHALVVRMAQVGEAEARSRAYGAPRKAAGPSYSAGFIRGRTDALGGRRWATTAVISADTTSLDQAGARRVQAILSGRHNRIDRDGFDIGTTPGHEGTAKVFSGTVRTLRGLVKELDLTKGLGG